jgi:hypothetical protein
MKWLTLDKFSEQSGMTKESIRALKKKGIWREKIHWAKAANGRIFINVIGVEKWIESSLA